MRTCEFCAAEIAERAQFCGSCGQLTRKGTGITHVPRPMRRVVLESEQTPVSGDDAAPTQVTGQEDPLAHSLLRPTEYEEEEEDDEEKRRLALIGLGLPLAADLAPEAPTANLPSAQGTPQVAGAPTAVGTPPPPVNEPPPSSPMPQPPLVLPEPPPARPPGIYSKRLSQRPGPHLPHNPESHLPHKPQPQPVPGCLTWLIIVIVVLLVIFASVAGVGLTILSPSLAMEGSAQVPPGGQLHLHGSHFIPGNAVTCTLDGSTVLHYASLAHPTTPLAADASSLALALQNASSRQTRNQATGDTTVIVNGDGTFNATFTVEQDWSAGQHTIRASESLSPRSASVTFTVLGAGQSVTPVATASATATAKAKATATATANPSATATTQAGAGLSAVSPGTVTFGPLGEGYNQTTTSQIVLSTAGTDMLNWTAKWDKAQAPWLQLNPQTGQIQAPGTQNITVGANAGSLKAGTYKATVTFSSQKGQSVTLNVALTIQGGCLRATPTTLNFTSAVGANNPPPQTVTLNNCGARGNWSATSSGGTWLSVTPTSGGLNAGSTQNIVVSASVANVQSKAGTYQGQIQFSNGTAQATVNVTFTVRPMPMPAILSASSNSLTTRLNCKLQQGTKGVLWRCPITLSSSANATSNLTWTSSGKGIAGITTQPISGTLTPGQVASVELDAPRFPCGSIGVVTFFGPANSVTVTLTC